MEIAARALIPALRHVAPGVRLTAFVGRDASGVDLGIEQVVVPLHARRRAEWVLAEQAWLPRLAARARCDLVHSLGGTAPARGRFARVVTVYDLTFARVPQAHFGVNALGMRMLVPLAARRSHRVIVPSRATAEHLRQWLPPVSEKIDVVELGPGRAPGPATAAAELRRRFHLGQRTVVVSLAAKRPHKGLEKLLEALRAIDESRRPVLVLSGSPTPYERQLRERIDALGLAHDVRVLGWLSNEDVDGLLAASAGLVLPSLSEGFGFPVLEAMARGVPVACSDREPLRDIAGGAALLFDPQEPAAIASALEVLIGDRAVTEQLVAAGRARAGEFSWRRTAGQTLESYERALSAATACP